jgi:hypothetical protein
MPVETRNCYLINEIVLKKTDLSLMEIVKVIMKCIWFTQCMQIQKKLMHFLEEVESTKTYCFIKQYYIQM